MVLRRPAAPGATDRQQGNGNGARVCGERGRASEDVGAGDGACACANFGRVIAGWDLRDQALEVRGDAACVGSSDEASCRGLVFYVRTRLYADVDAASGGH